jgi:predicted O-linked N-acetylglucosamine transferase (SPINDLY family)
MFGLFGRARTREADRLIAEGNRAEAEGRLAQACELYRRAIALAPRHASGHLNLGVALEALGELDAAAASQQAALDAEPSNAFAAYNLAKLRFARGDAASAEALVAQALAARADFPEALLLKGYVLSTQGRAEEALAPLERAAALRPADFVALYHYAQALHALGRLPQAEAVLSRALAIDPGNADALYDHGCVLRKLQRAPEAEAAFRRAVEREPGHARAWQMLGGVLLAQGRIAEARELYAAARAACPDDFGLASAELFSLLCDERVGDAEFFQRHVDFGRRLEAGYPARAAPFRNARDPARRLRIGYLSADFCLHVIALQLLGILEHHDRGAVEVYCYSTTEKPDGYTKALEARSDVWRGWRSVSQDAEIARAIADDGIDILVDLAGHSSVSQLAVIARRPAPVQATWIGYLATTGLTRVDYRLTDAIADPPGVTEALHTAALARLPRAQWAWRPFAAPEPAPRPPCLDNGYLTFGSFHGAMKLSPAVRRLWARILAELPDARFMLLGVPRGRAQEDLVRDLGVSPERITARPHIAVQEYMRAFDAVDVVLDTLPYSGANTTCDALFMGVPVLTAPGTRPASRSAASVLTSVGLQDWIAADADAYVRRAVALAAEKPLLAELRTTLRPRLQASPMMDERGFTRELEAAYRRMWERWCAGLPAQGW